jgi:hypothetical protein
VREHFARLDSRPGNRLAPTNAADVVEART